MSRHPSLDLPLAFFEPITPVEKMEPYKLCWCRSGKKYKFCHYRREKDYLPVNSFENEKEMLRLHRQGYCSHPDKASCNSKIVKSHSVQRNGGLASIAENGHVLSVKPTLQTMILSEGKPQPRRVGVGNASVFPGFCGKHDDLTFKPIEGASISLDKETAFIFCYRAFCYERFNKDVQLNCFRVHREADKGQPFWKQALIQTEVYGLAWGANRGMKDIDGWKRQFDEALIQNDVTNFHCYAIRLDCVIPVVVATAFHVEMDLTGKQLQKLGRETEYEGLSMTVMTFNSQSVAFFGWIGSSTGPAFDFVESVRALPDDRVADALIRIAFHQSDNLFLRESWWDGLTPFAKEDLLAASRSGTQMKARRENELLDKGTAYATANVLEKFVSWA